MFERPNNGERAVLVHITFHHVDLQADFQEFHDLAIAAKVLPVAEIKSAREKPDPKFYIGKGKVDEIAQMIQHSQADVVIFNHELTPSQERNIEREVKCRVLSRTTLILDIFASRARTFEGKLQVELAQLEHMSTRLVRGWTHLERQKGGIGLRGPGETQLETDRRLLRIRIVAIKKRLAKVRLQRQQSRHARARAEIPTIALVGYTNAGKSTLFNALTGAEVWVADQLFATLDPTLRSLSLPAVGRVVLADTVGFIRQLPHSLVEAFHATLEEVCQADLLLHVVDVSDQRYEDNIHQVNQVLLEIGAESVPQLVIFNKADALNDLDHPAGYREYDNEGKVSQIWVSALGQQGLNLLREALQGRLRIEIIEGTLRLSTDQGKLRAQLYNMYAITSDSMDPEGYHQLVIKTTKYQWDKLCQQHTQLLGAFRNVK